MVDGAVKYKCHQIPKNKFEIFYGITMDILNQMQNKMQEPRTNIYRKLTNDENEEINHEFNKNQNKFVLLSFALLRIDWNEWPKKKQWKQNENEWLG